MANVTISNWGERRDDIDTVDQPLRLGVKVTIKFTEVISANGW